MITFKLNPIRKTKPQNQIKNISSLLYCQACKKEDGTWFARVNTRGYKGYKDVTILPFSEKTFELKGKTNVFTHKKDKKGYYTRNIRTEQDSVSYPGNKEDYCALCDKCIFRGYIIKTINGICFDIIEYIGTYSKYGKLIDENDNTENK